MLVVMVRQASVLATVVVIVVVVFVFVWGIVTAHNIIVRLSIPEFNPNECRLPYRLFAGFRTVEGKGATWKARWLSRVAWCPLLRTAVRQLLDKLDDLRL